MQKSKTAAKNAATKKDEIKKVITLKNIAGEDVSPDKYFYAPEGEEVVAPPYLNEMCGYPVDREDLIEVFGKVFKPEDDFLFYKTRDKEVYIVIIPLKFATETVGKEHDSMPGDFQKHSMSFIPEGSVVPETLLMKLKLVAKSIGYNK